MPFPKDAGVHFEYPLCPKTCRLISLIFSSAIVVSLRHVEIPVVTKEAPATWVTSLVEWLGVHNMELHLSGPEYSGMLTQQDLPPTETPTQYRSSGIATVSELPTSTEEVLLRATQCWLIPELVDGNRVVFEVLGFTAAAG